MHSEERFHKCAWQREWFHNFTWCVQTYNARYVNIVEELLYEALTSHEKSNHGTFIRRSILK